MTEIVYLDRLDDTGAKTVSTMGLQPGPGGGDGWSVVAELPTSRLSANKHYAFWVTGKISNVRRSGATPVTGMIQLCLGDASGTKSPAQLVEIGAADTLGVGEGIPFAFLLIFSSSPIVVDPVWGATWSNASNLQLLGRTWWRNDTPAYVVEWDVTDLSWVWADLDAIPGADQLVTVATTPVTIAGGGGYTNVAGGVNTPGAAGSTWLHFFSVNYAPGVGSVPGFQVGYATGLALAGFTARIGTAGRFGMGHRGTATQGVQYHHGAFWVDTQPGATYLPAVRGREVQAGSATTTCKRFAVLSICLDNLTGVHVVSSSFVANLTDSMANLFTGQRRVPLELVGTSRSLTPWLFATGIVEQQLAQRRAYGIWVTTEGYDVLAYTVANEQTQGPNEAIACYGSGSQGLGPLSTAVQYQTRWIEPAFSGMNHHVRDVFFLTVFPVRDPDNLPPVIPGVGSPTEIVPGKESLGVGSLSAPPIAPDVATGETVHWRREQIEGATGHKRTWGVFQKPRRSFALSWGPLSTAQRDSVVAFLQANVAFRITPPREASAIPVVPIREVSFAQESAQTWRVDLEVVELVYTGP